MRMSTNAAGSELKQSAILIQCALGRRRLSLMIREEKECIAVTCQISSLLKKRKDLQKKLKRLLDKKNRESNEKKERPKEMPRKLGKKEEKRLKKEAMKAQKE